MLSMIRLAKRQTLHLWIALLAILFSALAPTVSHALAAGNKAASTAADTLQLCTVNGYKMVKLAGADAGDSNSMPADAMHGMQHCAFCTIHGSAAALPGAPAVALALDAGRDIYPPLFYRAPRALHTWSAANPRAPPFLA
jgi:uncharacterized protein involved in copper resistance